MDVSWKLTNEGTTLGINYMRLRRTILQIMIGTRKNDGLLYLHNKLFFLILDRNAYRKLGSDAQWNIN